MAQENLFGTIVAGDPMLIRQYCIHYATPGRCGVDECKKAKACQLSVGWLSSASVPTAKP